MIDQHTLNFPQLWRRVAHAARHRRVVQPHFGSCSAFVYKRPTALEQHPAIKIK